jgi:hypothetical protein
MNTEKRCMYQVVQHTSPASAACSKFVLCHTSLSARHGCGLRECHNITVENHVFLTCIFTTITQLLLSGSRNEVLTYV